MFWRWKCEVKKSTGEGNSSSPSRIGYRQHHKLEGMEPDLVRLKVKARRGTKTLEDIFSVQSYVVDVVSSVSSMVL